MSLHPTFIGDVPIETMRVAKAACPKGTVVMRLRDGFADLFRDEDFQALSPRRGKPGLPPWRLALVTIFQFLEQLSDRQAADAVRTRIDWKYAPGLDLADPGFSMKRQLFWTGYKVHMSEACDDGMAQVITDVSTGPSMRPDMTSTAGIHDRLATKGLLPSEHFVDSGHVDAELLVSSRRDHGVSLEGPVRGTSGRQGRAGGDHSLPDFRIDWDREQVTCPQGRMSSCWRRMGREDASPRIQVQFSRLDCGPCVARAARASAKTARRVMHFHDKAEYEALRAARARADDPAWLRRHHKRAGVEGTLSQGVRAFGLRRSRYISLAKTSLQQACTAAAMTVSRVVRWLDGVPRARTRTTRFASLAQPA